MAIAEALLRRDPGNLDARRAAVSAAIEMGDLHEADELVRDGRAASPDDPRVWLMAADLARAEGDNGQVLSDLRTAQTLRRQQIGADAPPASSPCRSQSVPPRRRRSAANADRGRQWPVAGGAGRHGAQSRSDEHRHRPRLGRRAGRGGAVSQLESELPAALGLDRPRSTERGDGAARGLVLAGGIRPADGVGDAHPAVQRAASGFHGGPAAVRHAGASAARRRATSTRRASLCRPATATAGSPPTSAARRSAFGWRTRSAGWNCRRNWPTGCGCAPRRSGGR